MANLTADASPLFGKHVVVALSGGLDSICLLHWLSLQKVTKTLRVIHCNHHLNPEANAWANWIKTHCISVGVECNVIDIFPEKTKNVEENARKLRYQQLYTALDFGHYLCTAHHQNDQAETLLLQLLRGAGLAGLASMPMCRKVGNGFHLRPFLGLDKKTLEHYAKDKGLKWINDTSNDNLNFKRNAIRYQTLPMLERLTKSAVQNIARTAGHIGESLSLIQVLAQEDINHFALLDEDGRFNISQLQLLPTARKKNVLRFHLSTLGCPPPSSRLTNAILKLLEAKADRLPVVHYYHYEIRRYKGRIYVVNTTLSEPKYCNLYEKFKNSKDFNVHYRQFGMRVKLKYKNHHRPLKKILQEAGIPPWERSKLRMYYLGERLVAIEGIGEVSSTLVKISV